MSLSKRNDNGCSRRVKNQIGTRFWWMGVEFQTNSMGLKFARLGARYRHNYSIKLYVFSSLIWTLDCNKIVADALLFVSF
jgi:hypothetical protein